MERCLIVEDHALYADVMQEVLRSALPGREAVIVASLHEARTAISQSGRFALIVLDLVLPDSRGLLGLMELQRLCPNTPIVINTAFADADVASAAMICGACGIIPKTECRDAVIAALQIAVAGGVTLPDCYRLDPEFDRLTSQQSRVLELVAEGFLNKQIAHMLQICETTVKAHMGEILRKLKVANRTQAMLKVTQSRRVGQAAFAQAVLRPRHPSGPRSGEPEET